MTTATQEAPDFAPYFRSRELRMDRDEELMRNVFQMRFQIYCMECGFLPAADYPDRQETDEHDQHSAHISAFNLMDGLVGYVRLVRPHSEQAFPFQEHCTALFESVRLPPVSEAAELSRLMVRKDYRHRRGDLVTGITVEEKGLPQDRRRENSPRILMSMYRQVYAYSVANGVRYWYVAMEGFLFAALRKMNLVFRQIGPQTDYYGPVAPYIADVREIEAGLAEANPALLKWWRTPEVMDF